MLLFLFFKSFKIAVTREGCVEMVIPWELCWTIGPLLRLPLARFKAWLRGG